MSRKIYFSALQHVSVT